MHLDIINSKYANLYAITYRLNIKKLQYSFEIEVYKLYLSREIYY